MSTPVLNAHEDATLRLADRSLVVNALAQVISAKTGPWLPTGHKLQSGITRDNAPGAPNALTANELASYLALAAPNHCMDGWGYLSRGLNAYLLGDPHSAWHFAYYAELRAAQSILSAGGCGAFNDWNAVIDSTGQIRRVDTPRNGRWDVKRTHTMVWLALPNIMQFSNGSAVLASSAEMFGHPLTELVTYAFPGSTSTLTASKWIKDWTFDIGLGIEDKLFRNRCSYDPHILTPHAAAPSDVVGFFENLWSSIQPSPKASFLEIDKFLIKRALHDKSIEKIKLITGTHQPSTAQTEAEMKEAYDRICASAPTFSAVQRDFFTNLGLPNSPIVDLARNQTPNPTDPKSILARATLLLRMSTGTTRQLLLDANYKTGEELDFWLSPLAAEQGIIRPNTDLENDRAELYFDGSAAVEDMSIAFSTSPSPANRYDLLNSAQMSSHNVCSVNRVPYWGFQP